ncbi:MAG: hypothetical protein AVDCRST_MAG66-683 [uncultured Pseudonocardia sp.]|uniref:Uncharacterized protein n=1 Tax=uncultured Pseudonocardia sp. TaxID=211455 RepID=A0A6J4NGI1_9PSEU|nr:MAG: hypothetical protein AVDCRST_MAG66-683 [uncultured Pseudonocardia sp.]
MDSSPAPTAPTALPQAGPGPRLLHSPRARRIAAACAALPFGLTLTATFLPHGPGPVLLGAAALPAFVAVVLVLRAATRWNSAKLRTLDERERGEQLQLSRGAYSLTTLLFVVLALVGMLGRFAVVPVPTPDDWVFLVSSALFTHLLLPYAVLAWRMADEPSEV